MALIALGLVILQGVMGGVRVLQVDREIARIHGCLGPAFFAFLAALMVVTSRWWQRVSELGFWIGSRNPMSSWSPGDAADLWRYGRSLWVGLRTQRQLTWAILGLAYGQLVLGASMRHVPETADPAYFRVLVWFHVVGAACVAVTALALTLAPRCPLPGLAAPRRVLLVAVGLQILLGLGTWVMKYSFPAGWGDFAWAQAHLIVSDDFYQVQIVTAHVAVGSLILAVATFSGVRLWRAERCLGHWLQWAEVPEEARDPDRGQQPSFDAPAGEAGENVPRPVAALTE
jgi:cytochrome c oxidase assembly protein subunit 15